MSHVPILPVFPNSSTLKSGAGHAKASLFISRRSAIPINRLSPSSMLRVYWSKQNESQDGHIEVSCDWLRWYSTEWTVVQDDNIVFSFFFFTLNLMHCSSTVQTPYLQLSRCSPLSPQVGSQGCEEQHGVDNLFLSLQWERENKTEREKKRERPSIHLSSDPSTPKPGAAAKPICEQKERGGAG